MGTVSMENYKSALMTGLGAGIGLGAIALCAVSLRRNTQEQQAVCKAAQQAVRTAALETLYRHPGYFSVGVTGGGGSLVSWMLSVPGCSSTLMDASVPYAREAMPLLITDGGDKDWPCNTVTAAAMADACFARAANMQAVAKARSEKEDQHQTDTDKPVFGISCTAALVSNRWRRGQHRAHISVRGATSRTDYTIVMEKGTEENRFRTRVEEDELTSELMLYAMLKAEIPNGDFEFSVPLADTEKLVEEVVGL